MTKSLTEDWKAKTGGLLANNNQPAEPKLLEQSACMKGCNFEEFTLIKLNCEDCPTITALYCPTEKRYWISSAGGMAYHVESYGPFYFQPTQKMLDYEAKKIAKKNYNKSRWWYPYLKNSKCAQ